MIISRTPLRISLVGGGTDMPEFFRYEPGAVVSFTIDKYITVCVADKFDGSTRVSYSKTENVARPKLIKHDLVRETLRYTGQAGVEIVSIADIPGEGTGLGSSSAFIVGLLKALYGHAGRKTNIEPSFFASLAYDIEQRMCHRPVGKQDHYAAAYGGWHKFDFNPNGTVTAEPLPSGMDGLRRYAMRRMVLLYTGKTRSSSGILAEQGMNFADKKTRKIGMEMRDLAVSLWNDLKGGNWSVMGRYLHDNWILKKQLAWGISDTDMDWIYYAALEAGAMGGKLLGAGGGGFFLFDVPVDKQSDVVAATGLRQVLFNYAPEGSEIVERW